MISRRTYLLTLLATIVAINGEIKSFNFGNFFERLPFEEVVDREYRVAPMCTLTISNRHGNINVHTEWKRNSVCVKAIKRAKKIEHLALFDVSEKHSADETHSHLSLASTCYDEDTVGRIDYELIVPANITLRLNTDKGSIDIKEVNGPIIAHTIDGNIEIVNTTNNISATSERSGSISITQARGAVRATTHSGDIFITDARHNVVAQSAKRGNILVSCAHVPATATIQLDSASGTIELALPSHVNALINGKTERGTLTCDHMITLKPLSTKLDKTAWGKFKKEVDGIMGNGEATIKLSNARGNIKILKTTA
jgi:hypothetical protein